MRTAEQISTLKDDLRPPLKMARDKNVATFLLYDVIDIFGFHAGEFAESLLSLENVEEIVMRIDSPGGNAFDGSAIYNLLREHKAKVTVKVDGIAGSAASIVAMAGDEILMGSASEIMIHDPYLLAFIDRESAKALGEILENQAQEYAKVYSRRSGLSLGEVNKLMKAETFMTASDAIERGFATDYLHADDDEVQAIKADAKQVYNQKIKERGPRNAYQMLKDRQSHLKLRQQLNGKKRAAQNQAY